MLYGTTNASHEGGDRDYDADGLGATSPSRRPAVITSGGGYSPQGGGSGGGPGAGETPVAGSRSAAFRPVDRNASIAVFRAQGKARLAFSKSGRGSRISIGQLRLSPISPISTAWGGLNGVEDRKDFDILTWSPEEQSKESSGLGSWFSGLIDRIGSGQAFKPPQTIINRIPAPVRKAARYVGAATATVVSGGFVPQSAMRKTFGLSPGESAQSEVALKVARGITVTVATVGAAGALGYGPGAGGAYTPSQIAAKSAAERTALNQATIAQWGATTPATNASLNIALPTRAAASPIGVSGTSNLIAPTAARSATIAAAMPTPISSGGFLANVGSGIGAGAKGIGSAVAAVGKAVGINIGTGLILSQFGPKGGSPGEGSGSGSQVYGSGEAPQTVAGQVGGGGGAPQGESGSGGESAPILAGATPVIGIGLALAGLAMVMGKTKLKIKSKRRK